MNSMRVSHLTMIIGLLATMPAFAQSRQYPDSYECRVFEETPEGTWHASRDIVENDGITTAKRDIYEWEHNEVLSFGPGMKLRWQMAYYWPTDVGAQTRIPEADILVDIHFAFEAQNGGTLEKPERSFLNFYRSAHAGKQRHPFATSLSTVTLWDQYGTKRISTRGIVSLDDLLAFGSGRDTLEWEIRSPPDASGRMAKLANGHFPIAALRGKPAAILKLRKQLDKKAANFRRDCLLSTTAPVVAPPPE
jgi:hypothetical protein